MLPRFCGAMKKIKFAFLVLFFTTTQIKASNSLASSPKRTFQKLVTFTKSIPDYFLEAIQLSPSEHIIYLPRKAEHHQFFIRNHLKDYLPEEDVYEVERRIQRKYLADKEWFECWQIFATGYDMSKKNARGDCREAKKKASDELGALLRKRNVLDPIWVSRDLVKNFGKYLGTKIFYEYVGALDQSKYSTAFSGSSLEARVKAVSSNHSLNYRNSLMSLSAKKQSKIGVVFVPGYGTGANRYYYMMDDMSKRLAQRESFNTYFIATRNKQGPEVNNEIIYRLMQKAFSENDKVIVISISKGTSDMLYAFLDSEYINQFSAAERSKLKLYLSISGVTRASVMAWWLVKSPSLFGKLAAAFHYLSMGGEEHSLNGVRALAKDPLEGLSMNSPRLKDALPSATWISVSAFPESKYAQVRKEKLFSKADKVFPTRRYTVAALDGVMEVSASVLPPSLGIPQWNMRLFGSHTCIDGVYDTGTPVTRSYREDLADDQIVNPGYELLENIFKSIPNEVVIGN